mgnify:CR=1 FL=1|tara:strand:+ start:8713 stop:9078 length:366 start_codon:yes stop_codon:yes gene_type:complete
MDRQDALRLVIFEYLLPTQRKARCDFLQSVLLAHRGGRFLPAEPNLAGLMKHLLLLSDALLNTRGYPTSFVYRYNRIQHHYCDRQLVKALVIPTIDMHHTFERMADPPGGYKIFRNWHTPY